MQDKWSDQEAEECVKRFSSCPRDLALRVYSSRLIGREPALVLHGGGNTSVKTRMRDDLGRELQVLCVKGSGWDLAEIAPEGLPALRLESLTALRQLTELDDEAMVNAQRTRMLDASAPNPSVETLLHAFLPHKFIDHSHADAILSVVDQPKAEKLCGELYGNRLAIVPYIMPGFALAKLAAEVFERNPQVEGLLLLQHGLFTFGDSAKQSYERHIRAVTEAEQHSGKRRYWSASRPSLPPLAETSYGVIAPILRGLLGEGERRYVLELRTSTEIQHFVDDPALDELSQQGPATPDHVIRTKAVPLVLRMPSGASEAAQRDHVRGMLGVYRERYKAYVARQMMRKALSVRALDPDPRVILVPSVGLIAAGKTPKDAAIAADLYAHTIEVIRGAEAAGQYQALSEDHLFDMEYWSLEQAKLGKAKPRAFEGQVVYVTGAARGIGEATARAFAADGAVVYAVDRDAAPLEQLGRSLKCATEPLDVTDEHAVRESLGRVVARYGGVDGVVSNAGIAPQSAIDACSTALLEQSFRVNLYAHQFVLAAAAQIMKRQGTGGFLLLNASKSAWNPGPGFGPYSIPKAALLALMKQYALELGDARIRCNAVNADRIRTGLLEPGDVERRAEARGLDTDAYYKSNLLGREVTAEDVAQAFVMLARAQGTTGSVLTVDGGNIAASPR